MRQTDASESVQGTVQGKRIFPPEMAPSALHSKILFCVGQIRKTRKPGALSLQTSKAPHELNGKRDYGV